MNLPSGVLDVVADRYTRSLATERTGGEVTALAQELVAALTEIGLTVLPGTRKHMITVERCPQTPPGGRRGDANLIVGIYSNRAGWNLSANADGATVLSIAAPATTTGAAEVAALVRSVAHGELGNVFRR
ncbi:hypothetical protein OH749_31260 (plasmid) [Streptomyces albidoflavus]|uniref:hypothetical protein n=1 Tax=Streptomyces albidoflavus TaxID=1886 RepID=UPI002F91AC34|nr:hypothetical protein OH749_31260 [Streptomyces albidoflavus]